MLTNANILPLPSTLRPKASRGQLPRLQSGKEERALLPQELGEGEKDLFFKASPKNVNKCQHFGDSGGNLQKGELNQLFKAENGLILGEQRVDFGLWIGG